jgi:hypothetical protein
MIVEQAEIQLRIVMPIEEEEEEGSWLNILTDE